MKPMHSGVTGPCKHGGEVPLEVMACQGTKGIDDSFIQPLVAKLCRVASCIKMSFRDTWSLSIWDEILIVGHGKSIIKMLKKDLGSQFENT